MNPTVPMIDVASLHQSSPPWAQILRRSAAPCGDTGRGADLSGAKVAPIRPLRPNCRAGSPPFVQTAGVASNHEVLGGAKPGSNLSKRGFMRLSENIIRYQVYKHRAVSGTVSGAVCGSVWGVELLGTIFFCNFASYEVSEYLKSHNRIYCRRDVDGGRGFFRLGCPGSVGSRSPRGKSGAGLKEEEIKQFEQFEQQELQELEKLQEGEQELEKQQEFQKQEGELVEIKPQLPL